MSYFEPVGADAPAVVFTGATTGGTMTPTGIKNEGPGFWATFAKAFTSAATPTTAPVAPPAAPATAFIPPPDHTTRNLLIGGGVAVGALVLVLLLKK